MARRVFKVRRLRASELDLAAEMRKRIDDKQATTRRVVKRYNLWCALNKMTLWETSGIGLFLAQVRKQLTASSASSHAHHLLKFHRLLRVPPPQRALLELKKEYAEEYAEKGVQSQSPDFERFEDAVRLVDSLRGKLQAAASAMLFLGPRCKDVGRLRSDQVVFKEQAGKRAAALRLKRTKGRRHVRYAISLHFGNRQLRLASHAMWASMKRRNWFKVTYAELDEAVKVAADALQVRLRDDRQMTVGALRRAFIHYRIAVNSTRSDTHGLVVNWDAVARETGHCKISTLQAHYDPDISADIMKFTVLRRKVTRPADQAADE